MRFVWLTLAFASLGALGGGIYGGLTWRGCSSFMGSTEGCFTRGSNVVLFGFVGLMLGTALGLFVWLLRWMSK